MKMFVTSVIYVLTANACFAQLSDETIQDLYKYAPIDHDDTSVSIDASQNEQDTNYVEDNNEEDNFSITISEGVIQLAKNLLYSAASTLAAFAFGSIAVVSICRLTPLCTTIAKSGRSLQEFRSLVKPERLNSATRILRNALDRYSKLNRFKRY